MHQSQILASANVVNGEGSTPRGFTSASISAVAKLPKADEEWFAEMQARMRGHLVALMAKYEKNSSQFAKQTGLSSGTLTDILQHNDPISLRTLAKIRRAFPTVSIDFWIDEPAKPAQIPEGKTGVRVRQPAPEPPSSHRAVARQGSSR